MRGRRRRGDERVCGDAGGGGSAAGGAGRGAHPAVSVQGHRLGPRAHAHPGVALESVHFPAPPGREVCPPGHAQAVAGGGGGEGAAARLQHRRPQEHLLTLNAAIGSTDVSLLRLSLLCWRHHCWRYHCCAGEGAVSRLRLAQSMLPQDSNPVFPHHECACDLGDGAGIPQVPRTRSSRCDEWRRV